MRPQGDIRLLASAALIDGGGTTREISERIGAGRYATRIVLRNMCQAGDVQKTGTVRVPGVKRPVPFYERVRETPSESAQAHERVISLIALWVTPASPGSSAAPCGPCSSTSGEERDM